MTDWPRQPDQTTCGPSCVVVAEGLPGPWPDFAERVFAMHRKLNKVWPIALGTTPWAVAHELGGKVRPYRTADVLAALPHPVPIYLGNRWSPRHVVLALSSTDGEPDVYDPARGVLAPVSTCSWKTRWFTVLPR